MSSVRAGSRPADHALVGPPLPPRRPRRRLAILLSAAAVLSVVAVLMLGGGRQPARPAAGFSLGDVRGGPERVALEGRRGRPVVLNFFASWCVPCRKELPVLERAHRRTTGGVAFIGVAVDDSRPAATEMLDRAGVSYPAGDDPDKAVAGRYGLRGMPTTVFIGRDGRVVGRVEGTLTPVTLDRWLGRLGWTG